MVRSGNTRAAGTLAAFEDAKDEVEALDQSMEVELPEERERTFRTPGFSRMRFDWNKEDRPIINQAKASVDGRIIALFPDMFQVMHEIFDLVRTPLVDEATGEIKVDQFGFKIWKQTASGSYEEDWSRLTQKEKEGFLFTITTRVFDWSLRASELWLESMLAKSKFEERFSIAYDAPMHGTVDDRKAAGNIDAREERYFAIYVTALSRRADAMIRSVELLAQRLRDSLTF